MTPRLIVDPSVALAWCFLDEATPAARNLLEAAAKESILVPAWWYLEVANALIVAERRGRIDAAKSGEFIALVNSLSVEIDTEGPDRAFDHLMPLCRAHQLTCYDAVYLDLALRRQLPLATLDEPLRKAAKKLRVRLLGR
ncbi:MAG: type II toxin-antitoxin system VapC family toxin [Pirellulales bacterium]